MQGGLKNDIFPIEKSDFYKLWLLEQEEIKKHKWVLSEKIGKDVGHDYAVWDWGWNHREKWLQAVKNSGLY